MSNAPRGSGPSKRPLKPPARSPSVFFTFLFQKKCLSTFPRQNDRAWRRRRHGKCAESRRSGVPRGGLALSATGHRRRTTDIPPSPLLSSPLWCDAACDNAVCFMTSEMQNRLECVSGSVGTPRMSEKVARKSLGESARLRVTYHHLSRKGRNVLAQF